VLKAAEIGAAEPRALGEHLGEEVTGGLGPVGRQVMPLTEIPQGCSSKVPTW